MKKSVQYVKYTGYCGACQYVNTISCVQFFSCGDKFPWGEVHVELRVTDGVCRDAAVCTNAMDAGLSGAVK